MIENGYGAVKRAFDFSLAAVGIAVMAIPMTAISVAIRLTSKGPAIHWSRRMGANNCEFRMPKFRTMRTDTPQVATHLMADAPNYVTPLGRVLRRTSLDELPQMYSILVGDMSFVGPRPALYNQDDLMSLRTQRGIDRLIPGLTGWAQVNGRDELPIPIKVDYDAYYLEHRSFSLDLKILLMTALKTARGEGVRH
jgi:O-antigen biosynthesis protein WbqP